MSLEQIQDSSQQQSLSQLLISSDEEFSEEVKALKARQNSSYRPTWLLQTQTALKKFETAFEEYSKSKTDLDDHFEKYDEKVRIQEQKFRRRASLKQQPSLKPESLLFSVSYYLLQKLFSYLNQSIVVQAFRFSRISRALWIKCRQELFPSFGTRFLGEADSLFGQMQWAVVEYSKRLALFRRTMRLYREGGMQKNLVNNSFIGDLQKSLSFVIEVVYLTRFETGRNFQLYRLFRDFVNQNFVVWALVELQSCSNTLIKRLAFLAIVSLIGVEHLHLSRLKSICSTQQFIKNQHLPVQERLKFIANAELVPQMLSKGINVKPFHCIYKQLVVSKMQEQARPSLELKALVLYNRLDSHIQIFYPLETVQEGKIIKLYSHSPVKSWLVYLQTHSFLLRLHDHREEISLQGSLDTLLGGDSLWSHQCWLVSASQIFQQSQ